MRLRAGFKSDSVWVTRRSLITLELERRNYSETTVQAYLHTIEDFARYYFKPNRGQDAARIRARRRLGSRIDNAT